jgi:hypothetical protein
LVTPVDYSTLIVVPEVSLCGDQRRDRAVYYVPGGMNQRCSARSQVEHKEGGSRIPIDRPEASQLIVFDINAKGMNTAFSIILPMVANSIFNEFKVPIEKRRGVAVSRQGNTAQWQVGAEVIPVGGRRARRQNFTEHRDLLVGVENLAQYIGAGSLSADDHKQPSAGYGGIGSAAGQDSHNWRRKSRRTSRIILDARSSSSPGPCFVARGFAWRTRSREVCIAD